MIKHYHHLLPIWQISWSGALGKFSPIREQSFDKHVVLQYNSIKLAKSIISRFHVYCQVTATIFGTPD
jgi:hypothetical protein